MKIKKSTKKLLIVFVLFLPTTAFSQKLEKPYIDKVANDTTYITSKERIASEDSFTSSIASYIYARAKKLKHSYALNLELDLTIEGHKYFVVPKDKKVNITLTNSTVVSLLNYSDEVAEQKTIKKGFVQRDYESALMNYIMSKDEIDKILASDVSAISIETDEQMVYFVIKPKENETIKKLLLLVANIK